MRICMSLFRKNQFTLLKYNTIQYDSFNTKAPGPLCITKSREYRPTSKAAMLVFDLSRHSLQSLDLSHFSIQCVHKLQQLADKDTIT